MVRPNMTQELVPMSFKLPRELREKLQEKAREEDRSESSFIRRALCRVLAVDEEAGDDVQDEEAQ